MSDQYIGEIRMFAGNFPPLGWAFCDGQVLRVAENDVLFSLMGATYGGDGQTTFALPDLRGRIPMHIGAGNALGAKTGTETVTLTPAQLPAHTHSLIASSANGTQDTPLNGVWAASANLTPYNTAAPNAPLAPTTITPVGGGQPHDNMMPFTALSFIIATEGLYPTQD